MTTFLNFNYDQTTPKKFIKKHIIFSLLWVLNVSVILFRLDTYIFKLLNIDITIVSVLVPFVLLAFNILVLFKQKWFFSLAFIFYPLLIIFWFLPKAILKTGKLYLLLYYLAVVIDKLNNFKRSAINFAFLFFVLTLLVTTDSKYSRWLAVIYFTYIYFTMFSSYLRGSFSKADPNEQTTKGFASLKKIDLVENIEKQKEDEKLTEDEKINKKIKRVILWSYFLEYITQHANGRRGKRAFLIVWFFQYFFYFFATLFFFTFLNYQLFNIDSTNYSFTLQPKLFDFFYYTLKTVTFSNVDYLKPISNLARGIEICSYAIMCIYFLIITLSSIFSLMLSDYSKDMEEVIDVCKRENEKLTIYLKVSYDKDFGEAMQQIKNISEETSKLKSLLERLL